MTLSLVADHALTIEIEPRLRPLVERWIPRHLAAPPPGVAPRAAIEVTVSTSAAPQRDGAPTLALGSVKAWVSPETRRVALRGAARGSAGAVDLATHRATLHADPARATDAAADLYSMLTVTSALLLAGLGRALVHAAGVVAPEGGGWLLVGDAHAGKSTTCATLVRAGWDYLSDDQVVIAPATSGVVAESWLRPFHLDRGWKEGDVSGDRLEVAPNALGPGLWRRAAPLVGLVFPTVEEHRPTELTAISPGEALAGLLRQSPWLLVDRTAAPGVLALLQRGVETTASYRLRLGLDTYRDGERLSACLAPRPVMR